MRPRPIAPLLTLLLALVGPALSEAALAERLAESIAELANPNVLDTAPRAESEEVGPLAASAAQPAARDARTPSFDATDLASGPILLPLRPADLALLGRPVDVHGPPGPAPRLHLRLRVFRF